MIYIRKIYNQDIDANHQMQVVKEPAYTFFNFPYNTTEKNLEDKSLTLHLENFFNENGVEPIIAQPIASRIYQSSATKKGKTTCEARLGSDLRNYLKANLQFEVGDILVLRNKKGKGDIDYSNIYVDYVSSKSSLYQAYNAFLQNENHCVAIATEDEDVSHKKVLDMSLQQITYGAPGTGKSHGTDGKIKEIYPTKDEQKDKVFRTTFHPDSDYSTFVGAYKPIKKTRNVWVEDKSQAGRVVFPTHPETGRAYKEDVITYDFVPQAFTKAYVNAWKEYLIGEKKPVFLVVEEINRGNCAQIFGDLFQLLDREDNYFSCYPIKPDTDLGNFIAEKEQLGDIESDEFANIVSGEEMLLPPNLYIWATMNTSDQSLFPIDSAFKRRWDWKYVPIDTQKESWRIAVNGNSYDWTDFLKKINAEIEDTTTSEDKMLGFYFCKADNKVISAEKFVGKVIFYLWNDVFKDYGYDKSIFDDEKGKLSFRKFYNMDGSINEEKVEKFLRNLKVNESEEVDASSVDSEEGEEENGNTGMSIVYEGEVIREKNDLETYVKALEKIGVDRIAPLDILCYGQKIVAVEPPVNYAWRTVNGYKVLTFKLHKHMERILNEIATKLKIDVQVSFE